MSFTVVQSSKSEQPSGPDFMGASFYGAQKCEILTKIVLHYLFFSITLSSKSRHIILSLPKKK